jgi:hypothetical protein
MSIVGEWILHYDWGCSGSYSQTGITFNNDGTFSTSEEEAGKWAQTDGMILFQFDQWDSIRTNYGGNSAGNAIVGMMSTFAGSNGCWYAIRVGSTTMLAKERKPEFDASGKKAKQ